MQHDITFWEAMQVLGSLIAIGVMAVAYAKLTAENDDM